MPVGIALNTPTPTARTPPTTTSHLRQAQYVAIDVTIPRAPPMAPPGLLTPLTSNLANRAHHVAAKRKFYGSRATTISPSEFLSELTDHNVCILPFTVDQFGQLGSFAHDFLFGTKPIFPDTPLPDPPPWTRFTNPSAAAAFTFTRDCAPRALLPSATNAWHAITDTTTHFGSTYHSRSPTQWATQSLALNITTALHTHIAKYLSLHLAAQPPAKLRKHTARGPPFHFTATHPLFPPHPVPVEIPYLE